MRQGLAFSFFIWLGLEGLGKWIFSGKGKLRWATKTGVTLEPGNWRAWTPGVKRQPPGQFLLILQASTADTSLLRNLLFLQTRCEQSLVTAACASPCSTFSCIFGLSNQFFNSEKSNVFITVPQAELCDWFFTAGAKCMWPLNGWNQVRQGLPERQVVPENLSGSGFLWSFVRPPNSNINWPRRGIWSPKELELSWVARGEGKWQISII